jgi:hypothetical protein
MATYTDINGVKLITTGDESGTWGSSTNVNLQIIERAANGFVQIALTGTSYTLTLSNQPSAAENGHYKAIESTGTPGGTCTVTLAQNDHARVYLFLNSTNQSVVFSQGSGSNVTLVAGESAIVIADGAGSGAAVKDLTSSLVIANSQTTATDANTNSAIVARDGSGNFSAGTITADLTGTASSATTSAALTGDVSKTGDFTVDASGDIILDADGNDILFKDGGTTVGSIDIGTASTLKVNAGTTEELRVTTSGLNVLNGLRVGDTTSPTDNDIHATADISAGGDFKLTAGASDWSFEVASNNLIIKYGSTTLFKLDTSGNLSVEGNITAYESL